MNFEENPIEEENSISKRSKRVTNRRRLHQLYHSTDFGNRGRRNQYLANQSPNNIFLPDPRTPAAKNLKQDQEFFRMTHTPAAKRF